MKISIITPYRDAEPWLVRCLNSLTDMAGPFEFIFVDDSSRDHGPEIVRDYAKTDSRIIDVKNINAPGVSGARNTGIDIAGGDWVTFLDADDKINTGAESAFKRLESFGDVNTVQFNHLRYYPARNMTALKYTNTPGIYTANNLPAGWFYVWNKVWRREFLNGVRFREGMQCGEDELFVLSCLAKDKRIRCDDAVAVVHCFDNRGSLSKQKTAPELLEIVHALEGFLLEQSDPELRTALCLRISDHWKSTTFRKLIGKS